MWARKIDRESEEGPIISPERRSEWVSRHAQPFWAARPFPHVVIDGFLPEPLVREVAAVYPGVGDGIWVDEPSSRGKLAVSGIDQLSEAPGPIARVLRFLNSRDFVEFLESLTGIRALVPDPELFGAGMSCVVRGGHLDIHADFNVHEDLDAYRRLNLLVYLAEGWRPGYGGELELWDADMTRAVQTIPPLLNRAVLFETTDCSFHGHPNPINGPPGWVRRSISLYYYTRAPGPRATRQHGTIMQVPARLLDGDLAFFMGLLRDTALCGPELVRMIGTRQGGQEVEDVLVNWLGRLSGLSVPIFSRPIPGEAALRHALRGASEDQFVEAVRRREPLDGEKEAELRSSYSRLRSEYVLQRLLAPAS